MSSSHKVRIHSPLSIYILKQHLKVVTKFIYFRRFSVSGQENLKPVGTPVVLACNHQNCMIDPVALILPLHRYGKFMTRGSVFANKIIGRTLRRIGAIPIYRIDVDGLEATASNNATWQVGEEELLAGQTVTLFAEGRHQHKRVLGEFQSGYTRLAFEAARKTDFARHIFIQPAALHYDNYEHMQSNVLVQFGQPLDIEPYYELFKSKPRTAQRQVNAIVRQRVEEMMLNIADNGNYDAKEFACLAYDRQVAKTIGLKRPNSLASRLIVSQRINKNLAALEAENPAEAQRFFAQLRKMRDFLTEENLRTWVMCDKPSWGNTLLHLLWQILLLPIFVLGLLPNILIAAAPYPITRRLRDERFRGSVRLGVSLVTIPIIYIAWFCVEYYITKYLAISLIHTALLAPMGIAAWHYVRGLIKLGAKFKYQKGKKTRKYSDIAGLNVDILQRLQAFAKS